MASIPHSASSRPPRDPLTPKPMITLRPLVVGMLVRELITRAWDWLTEMI